MRPDAAPGSKPDPNPVSSAADTVLNGQVLPGTLPDGASVAVALTSTTVASTGGFWILTALSVAQLISWGSIYYGFSLFIVPMERDLGWSRTAMNGALSLGLLVAGLCAYPFGRWIDAHGGRALMTGGSLLAAVLFFVWSRATTLPTLFLVWVGLGAAMAATLYDPAFAVLTRRYPASFRKKIIMLTLVGGFASTVFIPLTQYLVERSDWRSALIQLGLMHLLICAPLHLAALRNRLPAGGVATGEQSASSQAALARALRHPVFWALLLCFTCYYATFAAMTFHLVPLLLERHVSTGLIVTALALVGPAQVLARVLLLSLGSRLDTARVGQVVVLVFPLSIALLLLFPASTPMLFAAILLYGAANGTLTIVRGTAVPDLLWREGYGAINGMIAFPSNMAKALGPFGAALIWSASGSYAAVLEVVLLVALAGAVFFRVAVVHAVQPHGLTLPSRQP